MTNQHSFITGSRRYGEASKKSDIDLVVMLQDENDYALLASLADSQGEITCEEEYNGLSLTPLRFGILNLICCIHQLRS